MSYVIALAGKGGVGKTTTAALIVRYLLKKNMTPVLAVDADPNSNFAESIGIKIENTIGSVLADFLKNKNAVPPGMSRQAFLELKLHQILKEEKGIDMLVMGCPEGPGCYCAANSMLKSYFENLSGNYKYVVIDNEAGMEHFSRKTDADIDLLIICSNYSHKGLLTAARLSGLADNLGLRIKRRYLLVNQAPAAPDRGFMQEMEKTKIPYLGRTINDSMITDHDIRGLPLTDLPDTSAAVKNIEEMLNKILTL